MRLRTMLICALMGLLFGCSAPSGNAYTGVPRRHHSDQKLQLAIDRARAQPQRWRIGIDPVAVPAEAIWLAESHGATARSLGGELSALFDGFVRGTGAFVVLPDDGSEPGAHNAAAGAEMYLSLRVLDLKLGGSDPADPNAYTLQLGLKVRDLRTGRVVFDSESLGYVRRGNPLRFAGMLADDPALLAASRVPMEHLFIEMIDRVY